MKRNRWVYFALGGVVMLLGLASRRWGDRLPDFIAEYAGDTLWALLVFLGVGWLRPKNSTLRVGSFALLFAYVIEVSQLYHAPWIESLRGTTVGGLILGFGFLWSDFACYTAGVLAGMVAELTYRRILRTEPAAS